MPDTSQSDSGLRSIELELTQELLGGSGLGKRHGADKRCSRLQSRAWPRDVNTKEKREGWTELLDIASIPRFESQTVMHMHVAGPMMHVRIRQKIASIYYIPAYIGR